MGETGERAARALLRSLREKRRPGLAVAHPGVVIPSIMSATALQPLAGIIAEARASEAAGDCDISVMAGFSYADSANTGMSVICVDWDGQAAAEAKAEAFYARLYEARRAIASAIPILTVGEALADLARRPARGRPMGLLSTPTGSTTRPICCGSCSNATSGVQRAVPARSRNCRAGA